MHYQSIRLVAGSATSGFVKGRTWQDLSEVLFIYNNMVWFLGLATLQLLWIWYAPQSYSRRRHSFVLLGRALRLAIMIYAQLCALRARMSRWYLAWVQKDIAATGALLARRPMAFVVWRLLNIHTGANHIVLHTFMSPLPCSLSGYFNIAAFALGCIHQIPAVVQMTQATPAAQEAMDVLCSSVNSTFEMVFGLPSWRFRCSPRVLEVITGAAAMLWGCLMPFLLFATMEYLFKVSFVQRMLEQQWQEQLLLRDQQRQHHFGSNQEQAPTLDDVPAAGGHHGAVVQGGPAAAATAGGAPVDTDEDAGAVNEPSYACMIGTPMTHRWGPEVGYALAVVISVAVVSVTQLIIVGATYSSGSAHTAPSLRSCVT